MTSAKEADVETDTIIELLEIYIHSILFARELYPAAIFRPRKAYNIPVQISIFKPLNDYLEKTLRAARELKRQRKLHRIELRVYKEDEPAGQNLESYVWELEDLEFRLETDEHMLQLEEQIRRSLLNLDRQLKGLRKLPSGATFKILLHTTEAAFVRLGNDVRLQNAPFVQEEAGQNGGEHKTNTQLLPVSHTTSVGVQLYVEEYL